MGPLAIQYNHNNGTIWVTTGIDDTRAFIEVANTGEILEQARVSTFTEPFMRARGRTRSEDLGNRGLGLAIVASITAAHEADLILTAREGGVRVQAR
ncbi:ATP-binding protein [Xylanimonas ulmi]|uniref:ATP-binding protein n=1 Tax=Xylanimonas ulmi TaxID=228973 RepID=UPI00102CA681|nr:ATP-binding protein [Xylanibacterium ulmi]